MFFLIRKLASIMLLIPYIIVIGPTIPFLLLGVAWYEHVIKKVKGCELFLGSVVLTVIITVPLLIKLLYLVGVFPSLPSISADDLNSQEDYSSSPAKLIVQNPKESLEFEEYLLHKSNNEPSISEDVCPVTDNSKEVNIKKPQSMGKFLYIIHFMAILGVVVLTVLIAANGFELAFDPDND